MGCPAGPSPESEPEPETESGPSSSPTPLPTTISATICPQACEPISGANTPECYGQREEQCKSMIRYEGKCQWVRSCKPDASPGENEGNEGCRKVCQAKVGQNTPEC